MDLEREIQKLGQRKANVRPEELHKVLTAAGFTRRFGKGDHWIYSHPAWPPGFTLDPRRPTVLPVYVTTAIRAMKGVLADEAG
jgi:hypothetical protein